MSDVKRYVVLFEEITDDDGDTFSVLKLIEDAGGKFVFFDDYDRDIRALEGENKRTQLALDKCWTSSDIVGENHRLKVENKELREKVAYYIQQARVYRGWGKEEEWSSEYFETENKRLRKMLDECSTAVLDSALVPTAHTEEATVADS